MNLQDGSVGTDHHSVNAHLGFFCQGDAEAGNGQACATTAPEMSEDGTCGNNTVQHLDFFQKTVKQRMATVVAQEQIREWLDKPTVPWNVPPLANTKARKLAKYSVLLSFQVVEGAFASRTVRPLAIQQVKMKLLI